MLAIAQIQQEDLHEAALAQKSLRAISRVASAFVARRGSSRRGLEKIAADQRRVQVAAAARSAPPPRIVRTGPQPKTISDGEKPRAPDTEPSDTKPGAPDDSVRYG